MTSLGRLAAGLRSVPTGRIKISRVFFGTTAGLFALLVVGKFILVLQQAIPDGMVAFDFRVYADIAHQWLDTGAMYAHFQLAGPYVNTIYLDGGVVNSYPPPITLLFTIFVFVPAILWWIIPLSIMTSMAVYWRPAPWSWPVVAASLALLPFAISVANGNSILWAMAATALATKWPGAALGLAGKPILLPFALPFLRPRRSWAVAGVIAAALALVTLPWWSDYIVAARNGAVGLGLFGSLFYYFPHQFLVLVPLVPWIATTRPKGARARSGAVPIADAAPVPT
ncbi:MAG TPA: hypothetical protein VGM49_08720 [Candidatus Limnocylindrales bacterium]|jgi:hypothetical protein